MKNKTATLKAWKLRREYDIIESDKRYQKVQRIIHNIGKSIKDEGQKTTGRKKDRSKNTKNIPKGIQKESWGEG